MKNNYPKDDKLFEELASIQHNIWSDWQKHLHSNCIKVDKGLLITQNDVWRWERQIKTNYKDLSEPEKDSDRKQVMRYFNLIKIMNFNHMDDTKDVKKEVNILDEVKRVERLIR